MRLPVLNTLFATTITWCFVLDAASSSAVSTSSNDNIVSTQQDLSTRQFTDHLCACFTDRTELQRAISQFLKDGCSDDNNCDNTVVQNYGWPIGSWCVSNVTSMTDMFLDASSFNQDLSSWDVSQVTNMSWMFSAASSFNQDLSSWDVSQVTGMNSMFEFALSFNQDLSSWDVSQVRYMSSMFLDASSFNQDLSSWDVSQVTYGDEMFGGTAALDDSIFCSWSATWKRLVDCTERTSAAPTPTISTAPSNGERTSASATLSILYGASLSLLLVHLLINY